MNRIWHWTEVGMDSIFIENWQRNRDGILYPRFTAFEIGYDQGKAVSQLLDQAGFKDIHVKKDLAGLDRVVYAVKACRRWR